MASCARVLPDCDARCARRLAPTMGRSSLHSYRSSCGDHLLCASMNSAAPPSLGLTSVIWTPPAMGCAINDDHGTELRLQSYLRPLRGARTLRAMRESRARGAN